MLFASVMMVPAATVEAAVTEQVLPAVADVEQLMIVEARFHTSVAVLGVTLDKFHVMGAPA